MLMGELWINQTVGTVTVLVRVIGFHPKTINKWRERVIKTGINIWRFSEVEVLFLFDLDRDFCFKI